MVLATAVPKTNAAMKLKKAAQMTARRGESTRVETTVAMLLAASWKPLMKSNASAIRMVTATNNPLRCTWLASLFLYVASLQPALNVFQGCSSFSIDVSGSARGRPAASSLLGNIALLHFLRALEDYAFQNIGSVFSLVCGCLQDFIQFFKLDQGDWIFLFFEQHGNGGAGDAVGFIFQPVDFDAVLKHVVMLFAQARQSVSKLIGLFYDETS